MIKDVLILNKCGEKTKTLKKIHVLLAIRDRLKYNFTNSINHVLFRQTKKH